MNRSEFDRYAREAEGEERRSIQLLAAFVFIVLGVFIGAVMTEWAVGTDIRDVIAMQGCK